MNRSIRFDKVGLVGYWLKMPTLQVFTMWHDQAYMEQMWFPSQQKCGVRFGHLIT